MDVQLDSFSNEFDELEGEEMKEKEEQKTALLGSGESLQGQNTGEEDIEEGNPRFEWKVKTKDGPHKVSALLSRGLSDGCIQSRGIYFDDKEVYPASRWFCAPVCSQGSFPLEHEGVVLEVQANDLHPLSCCTHNTTFDLFVNDREIETEQSKVEYLHATTIQSFCCSFACLFCSSFLGALIYILTFFAWRYFGILFLLAFAPAVYGCVYFCGGMVGMAKWKMKPKPVIPLSV